MPRRDPSFGNLLRTMSRRGFFETLEFIAQNQPVNYSTIKEYDTKNRIVASRGSVTKIISCLGEIGAIKRTVIDSKPIRTLYAATEKGHRLLSKLQEIREIAGSQDPA